MRKQLKLYGAVMGCLMAIGIIVAVNQGINPKLAWVLGAILLVGVIIFVYVFALDSLLNFIYNLLFSKNKRDWQAIYERLFRENDRVVHLRTQKPVGSEVKGG